MRVSAPEARRTSGSRQQQRSGRNRGHACSCCCPSARQAAVAVRGDCCTCQSLPPSRARSSQHRSASGSSGLERGGEGGDRPDLHGCCSGRRPGNRGGQAPGAEEAPLSRAATVRGEDGGGSGMSDCAKWSQELGTSPPCRASAAGASSKEESDGNPVILQMCRAGAKGL